MTNIVVDALRKINGQYGRIPDYLVDRAKAGFRKTSEVSVRKAQNKVSHRTISDEPLQELVDSLRSYSAVQASQVQHEIEFDNSLLKSDETAEHYKGLENKPGYNVQEWFNLGERLGQFRDVIREATSFNTATKSFRIKGTLDSRVTEAINEVNMALSHADRLSLITDPQHFYESLAGRKDTGRKILEGLLREPDFNEKIRRGINSEGFFVIGPENIDGPATNQLGAPYITRDINHIIQLLYQEFVRARERDKQVAVSADIGEQTIRGNLKGVTRAFKYMGAGLVGAHLLNYTANQLGVDLNPAMPYLLGGVLIGTSWIPSYSEVAQIATGIDMKKFALKRAAKQLGREHNDMRFYRTIKWIAEETYQQWQVMGWFSASLHTAIRATLGHLKDPFTYGYTMSLQVGNNNVIGNIAMAYLDHIKPLVRKAKREVVKRHPEAIRYLNPESLLEGKDTLDDLVREIPGINKHLKRENAQEYKDETYQRIKAEANRLADEFMEEFGKKSEFKKELLIIRTVASELLGLSYLADSVKNAPKSVTRKVSHLFARTTGESRNLELIAEPTNGVREKLREFAYRSKVLYPNYIMPTLVGVLNFVQRPFGHWNMLWPVIFWQTYERLSELGISPDRYIVNTEDDMLNLLAIGLYGVLAQATVTAGGAFDTAAAALSAAKEVTVHSLHKAKNVLRRGYNSMLNNPYVLDIEAENTGIAKDKVKTLLDKIEGEFGVRTKDKYKVGGKKEDIVESSDGKFFANYSLNGDKKITLSASYLIENGRNVLRIYSNRVISHLLQRAS